MKSLCYLPTEANATSVCYWNILKL